ncbi:MAG: hypothetical protein M3Y23_00620 [Actinomycetota bacterium]|nr:hypothetical protein [Actinomycetota bacterium]
MKKIIVSTAMVLIGGLTLSTSSVAAELAEGPAPLRVKVASFNGKKKLKAAKKLKLTLSCSKDCGVRASFRLKLPGGVIKDKTSGSLPANRIAPLTFTLNSVATRYLKKNVRSAKFTVKVAAKDFETGKRTIKKRVFRFYR